MRNASAQQQYTFYIHKRERGKNGRWNLFMYFIYRTLFFLVLDSFFPSCFYKRVEKKAPLWNEQERWQKSVKSKKGREKNYDWQANGHHASASSVRCIYIKKCSSFFFVLFILRSFSSKQWFIVLFIMFYIIFSAIVHTQTHTRWERERDRAMEIEKGHEAWRSALCRIQCMKMYAPPPE